MVLPPSVSVEVWYLQFMSLFELEGRKVRTLATYSIAYWQAFQREAAAVRPVAQARRRAGTPSAAVVVAVDYGTMRSTTTASCRRASVVVPQSSDGTDVGNNAAAQGEVSTASVAAAAAALVVDALNPGPEHHPQVAVPPLQGVPTVTATGTASARSQEVTPLLRAAALHALAQASATESVDAKQGVDRLSAALSSSNAPVGNETPGPIMSRTQCPELGRVVRGEPSTVPQMDWPLAGRSPIPLEVLRLQAARALLLQSPKGRIVR